LNSHSGLFFSLFIRTRIKNENKLVEKPKKKTITKSIIVIVIVILWVFFGYGVIAYLFPEQFPRGSFWDWIADFQGLGIYDVCVNWVGSERGGECLSWKTDQRLENCPKIVIDKLEKEYCILE